MLATIGVIEQSAHDTHSFNFGKRLGSYDSQKGPNWYENTILGHTDGSKLLQLFIRTRKKDFIMTTSSSLSHCEFLQSLSTYVQHQVSLVVTSTNLSSSDYLLRSGY